MLKIVIPALAAAMLSACEPAPASLPSEVTMSREVLMDKIQGGWAGQIIGCTYGGPTVVEAGTLTASVAGAIPNGNDLVVRRGATLSLVSDLSDGALQGRDPSMGAT